MKHDISGVILAGGKSSRMGRDKTYLKIRGRRLIDIVLETFRPFFDDIIIATNAKSRFEEFSDVKVCEDLIQKRGPLGGIYTALKACRFEKALFAACDMPYLKTDLISRLLDLAQDDSFDCFVPITDQGRFAYPIQFADTPSDPDCNRVTQRYALTDTLPSADRTCPGYRDAGTGHSQSQGTF